jgi:hypothetical protein
LLLQKAVCDATQQLLSQQASEMSHCSPIWDTGTTPASTPWNKVMLVEDISFPANSTHEPQQSAQAAWQEMKQIIDDALHEVEDLERGSMEALDSSSVWETAQATPVDSVPPWASIEEATPTPSAVSTSSQSLWNAIADFCQTALNAASEKSALGQAVRDTVFTASAIAREIDHEWHHLPAVTKLTLCILTFVSSVVLLRPHMPFHSVDPGHQISKVAVGEPLPVESGNQNQQHPGQKPLPSHKSSDQIKAKSLQHSENEQWRLVGTCKDTCKEMQVSGVMDLERWPAERDTFVSGTAPLEGGAQSKFIALWRNLRWMCISMGNIGSMVPNGALEHHPA